MTKEEFLNDLRNKLNGFPKEEIEERVNFYNEMILDRVEEGKSEEEAIKEIGTVDEVVDSILKETPLFNLIKERVKPKRRLKGIEIFLLILGFPLWFPLLMVCFTLVLVAYLLIWVLDLVVYATDLALGVGSVGAIVIFFILLSNGSFMLSYLGMGILAAGLAAFFALACYGVTKLSILLSKKMALGIKRSFVGKGETK